MIDSVIAGGVVVGPGNKIVVVNTNSDSWSLPKGHLDASETKQEAAIREIFEETGIQDVTVIDELGEYQRYRTGKGGVGYDTNEMKHITMFLCITNQERLEPIDPTNPFAEWLSISDVADRLTNPKDKEFFSSVIPRLLRFFAE